MATSKTTLDKNVSMGRTATATVPDKNISMGKSDSEAANSAEEIINPPSSDDTADTAATQN